MELPILGKLWQIILLIIHKITDYFIKGNDDCKKIPSPTSLPLIGHTYLFLPGGKYSSERLTEAVIDMSRTLGPRFSLKLGGIDMFITTDSEDARILFRHEGKIPKRPTFEALIHYRKRKFNSVGVVPANGGEWLKFRNGVTPLLKLNINLSYRERQRSIAESFVGYIGSSRDEYNIVEDLYEHLMKYSIEAISVVCPGQEINCLSDSMEAESIITASKNLMDGLYQTLKGLPSWKIYKTEGYRKLEKAHEDIYGIMKKHLTDIKNEYDENPNYIKETQPFMYSLLSNDSFSWQDKVMLALEIFFGGIDATATTAAMSLHYLSLNEELQERAHFEYCSGQDEYLKACIKETLRLSPTAGANARFVCEDTQFGDYVVKEGTLVLAFGSVSSLSPKYFKDPLKYDPGRWLEGAKDQNLNVYSSLPFGHGPRMCPGRRLAVQEITVLLGEILKSYKLKPTSHETIGMVYRMNRIPDRPINIEFLDR